METDNKDREEAGSISSVVAGDTENSNDILIEKEVIFKDDLETIFGKRPFDPKILEETTE